MTLKESATIIAACIGAGAALVGAYFAYLIGERQLQLQRGQLEMQRSVLFADFLVRTAEMKPDQIRGVMNRACATNAFPREDMNALYKQMFGMTCPTSPQSN